MLQGVTTRPKGSTAVQLQSPSAELKPGCAAGSPQSVAAVGCSHPGYQSEESSRHSDTEGQVIQTA